MEVTQGHPSVCRNFLFPSFDAMILSNSFNLVNHLWISVMSWKRTGCGRQLGMCCLHGLFVCCGSVGWFSLSRRLRQDCQLPYALYLENICWQPCPCLHLSVIYCMYCTLLTFLLTDTLHRCCLVSFFVSCSSDHRQLGLAHGVVCRSDSKVSADWLQCVSNREVQHFILQSQPLTAVTFTMI